MKLSIALLCGALAACAPQRPLTQAEAQAQRQFNLDQASCKREAAAMAAAQYPEPQRQGTVDTDCRQIGNQITCTSRQNPAPTSISPVPAMYYSQAYQTCMAAKGYK